jgi:hypothetical protein
MNIVESIILTSFALAGLSVFVAGLPGVREELDALQNWDEDPESDYPDETSDTESVPANP